MFSWHCHLWLHLEGFSLIFCRSQGWRYELHQPLSVKLSLFHFWRAALLHKVFLFGSFFFQDFKIHHPILSRPVKFPLRSLLLAFLGLTDTWYVSFPCRFSGSFLSLSSDSLIILCLDVGLFGLSLIWHHLVPEYLCLSVDLESLLPLFLQISFLALYLLLLLNYYNLNISSFDAIL